MLNPPWVVETLKVKVNSPWLLEVMNTIQQLCFCTSPRAQLA